MFEFSIPIINKLAEKDKPFFAAYLTTSDHGPYILPEYFKPKSTKNKNIGHFIIEYADWSLKKYIKLAEKEKWFNNTIFVFVADHGAPMYAVYDMPRTLDNSVLFIKVVISSIVVFSPSPITP